MLFVREPMTVAFTLVLPLLFLFVLGGVFGNTPNAKVYGGHGPLDFYVPAYIGMV
jgi:ABC-2 type transport system permease protein